MSARGKLKNGIFFKKWDDQIYSTRYRLIIAPDMVDAAEFASKVTGGTFFDIVGAEAACASSADKKKGRHHIWFFFQYGAKPGTIAHEVIHGVNSVYQTHGTKLDIDNDEPQAYHTDFLVTQIHQGFEEFRKQKKEEEDELQRKTGELRKKRVSVRTSARKRNSTNRKSNKAR